MSERSYYAHKRLDAMNTGTVKIRRLPEAARTRWPLSDAEERRILSLLNERPDLVPPYDGLTEDNAVLVHRYLTGLHPIAARRVVLHSRASTTVEAN